MFYKNRDGNTELPEYTPIGMSIYDFMLERCKGYGKRIALSYYDKKISFDELIKNIDRVAGILIRLGVKKGDRVIVSLPAIPEAVYLFYAVNKVGGIFCGMDCRIKAKEIEDILSEIQPKVCFVSDFHLGEFRDIEGTQIVCVDFEKAISGVAAVWSFFSDLYWGRTFLIARKKNIITYSGLMRSYSKKNTDHTFEKIGADDVSAYFYTSGTTSGRKCVVLTNETMNSAVLQYSFSQEDFKNAGNFCNIMPLFTCYGITLGTHLPIILGMQIRMIPLFFGKNMKKLLINERPGYIITVPAHWEHFLGDSFKNTDLSFLRGAIIGGDKLDEASEDRLNEIFTSCNSKARVMRGYGLTEASTAVTTQPADTPKGSVGKTMCWSEIAIFEPGTDIPLGAGEKGEICVCGPNICKGYLNDKAATDALLKVHSDGRTFLHTGDIGYLDKNGFLFFCERIKRMYVRFDGTKISPFAIEQLMYKCPAVRKVLITAIADKEHRHGMCAKAYVVPSADYSKAEALGIIKKYVNENISLYMRPQEIELTDKLPTTAGGKFNYFIGE